MYNLSHFKTADQAELLQFIKNHPFALLIAQAENRSVATQIPLLIEERDDRLFLRGHLMRQQDHHKALEQNNEVLVLFTGPHAYVSATWYTTPQMGSTWNYITVHVRGKINFLDEHGLNDIMRKLTLHFEQNNQESVTIFDNLSAEYKSSMLKAIIGFEIEVDSIEHVFKMSQNRDEQSYDQIIDRLAEQGGDAAAVATIMKDRKDQVFKK